MPLRERLRRAGHEFRTRSDTEVVLHAYLQWGERCCEYLTGMFAFAVFDGRDGHLLLVRDRLGIKPLYYARHREDCCSARRSSPSWRIRNSPPGSTRSAWSTS